MSSSGTGPSVRREARVSVVVSTLHRPASLGECLRAVAEGTVLPAEVVVVDQSGRPLLDEERALLAHGLPLVHVPLQGRGLSASQNVGVDAARMPVVAVTDDDCVPDARWVETAERVTSDGYDLVTGRILPLPASGDRVHPLAVRDRSEPLELTRRVLPWDMGTGGNFAVRRDLYLRVRGNDERLGSGTPARAGNDLDLFWRLVRAGARARFDPALLVRHERATAAERRDRRWGYGAGVGAAVVVWARQRDRRCLVVLAAWLRMRARLLLRAAARGRLRVVLEEVRVLAGTVDGALTALRPPEPGALAGLQPGAPVPLAPSLGVLSPHCDDAALSLGATLRAHVVGGGQVRVVTVRAGDPDGEEPSAGWDRRAGSTSGEVARRRREEDRRACARLGVGLVLVDEDDGQYPRRLSDGALWDRVAAALEGVDEVLAPGHPLDHPDHREVLDGVLSRLPPELPVRLYVEQPYAAWLAVRPAGLARVRRDPVRSSVRWSRQRVGPGDLLAKARAVACYRSQLPLLAAPTRWPFLGSRGGLFLLQVLAVAWRHGEHVSEPVPDAVRAGLRAAHSSRAAASAT